MILQDPNDADGLASMIRQLSDRDLRERLGKNAAQTAQQYTWARNGQDLAVIFEEVLQRKARSSSQTLVQEM